MTTITIDRALLEQALEALDNIPHPPWRDKELADAIRAELAKPVEQQLPAWHDAPTCAGLWLCNYGILEVVCINQPDVDNFDDFYNAGGRWYGPIPQDAKAEGDAIKKG